MDHTNLFSASTRDMESRTKFNNGKFSVASEEAEEILIMYISMVINHEIQIVICSIKEICLNI